MRTRSIGSISVLVAVIALVALAPVPGAAQAPTRAPSTQPRTPWGDPDLQGLWDFRTITPLERPSTLAGKEVLTAEEAAEFERQTVESRNADRRDGGAARDVERAYNDFWWDQGTKLTGTQRTSLIVDPPDGRIPALTPEMQQRARAPRQRPVQERIVIGSVAHGPEDLGLSERCILGFSSGPPILPSAYNNNLQLFQTPGYVVIFTEMIHEARIVPLDGRPHLPSHIRQWLGDSRGRWEGHTLVVETTNFTDKTSFSGNLVARGGAGENLRLVERFTRVDADTLLYELTVNDPTTWTRPWTAAIPMKTTDGPIFEYACHEGNYGMFNLLAGARALEPALEGSSFHFVTLPPMKPGAKPVWHRTWTVDYNILLSGELVLMLDEGEVTLRPGDVVIQRNTMHAWRNSTTAPVRWVAVLVPIRRV